MATQLDDRKAARRSFLLGELKAANVALRRGMITDAGYGAIAIDVIGRLRRLPGIPKGTVHLTKREFDSYTFPPLALAAIAGSGDAWPDERIEELEKKYGPFTNAPHLVWEGIDDERRKWSEFRNHMGFVWGEAEDQLLSSARSNLGTTHWLKHRFNSSIARHAERYPHLHAAAGKVAIAVTSSFIGVALGWFARGDTAAP
jgi:hypothetical protein